MILLDTVPYVTLYKVLQDIISGVCQMNKPTVVKFV